MSPARRKPEEESGFVDFSQTVQDPAVGALLSQAERKKSEARLPRKEREKKVKERERMQARREQHTTYDIPPNLRLKVRLLAEDLRVPASQLATLALMRFLNDYEQGRIDLSPYKTPSRSPKFDWNLVFEEETGRGKRS